VVRSGHDLSPVAARDCDCCRTKPATPGPSRRAVGSAQLAECGARMSVCRTAKLHRIGSDHVRQPGGPRHRQPRPGPRNRRTSQRAAAGAQALGRSQCRGGDRQLPGAAQDECDRRGVVAHALAFVASRKPALSGLAPLRCLLGGGGSASSGPNRRARLSGIGATLAATRSSRL
jgi:hypothetical protein